MGVSKVILNGNTLIDVTQKTVASSNLLSGETALGADGNNVVGAYTPPASVTVESLSVTQNGTYTAPTGKAYSPVSVNVSGGSGLVYETGTWSPASDTTDEVILNFQNSHTDPPFFYMVFDCDEIVNASQAIGCAYFNHGQLFGGVTYGSTTLHGFGVRRYSANSTPLTGTGATSTQTITKAYNDPDSSSAASSQYWATNTGIKATASSRTFKAGRTYKWIAVWAPTT